MNPWNYGSLVHLFILESFLGLLLAKRVSCSLIGFDPYPISFEEGSATPMTTLNFQMVQCLLISGGMYFLVESCICVEFKLKDCIIGSEVISFVSVLGVNTKTITDKLNRMIKCSTARNI